ncbi:MAG: hypothetical protein EAZ92_04745 [Candidatus Kapaibacterium sp.]|nr:MAG: hypothetical protein EAZ92_04745 [Candidatus Kapabacteria bacterium]
MTNTKQHIALFTTHPLFQRHFATDLELIQNHVDAGDDVTVLYCDASLLACDINTYHEPAQCYLCQKTRSIGLSLLNDNGKGNITQQQYLRLTEQDKADIATLRTTFTSTADLQAYTVDNYDIGMAVLSSIVSYVMNADLDVKAHAPLIRHYIISGFMAYRSVQNFLRETKIDKFYLFNGRMAIVRAIMRACQSEGVQFTIHESGATNNSYSLFDNSLPHNIQHTTDMMRQHWEQASTAASERLRIAEEWYKNRAQGRKVNGYSFIEHQQQGLLPSDWNPNKQNIVIFNSADFEFVWVSEEYQHHIYQSQLDGITSVIDSLLPHKERYHVYLRIHPNLAKIENELRPLLQFQSENLTTILPNDKISSYALIEHASKVVTFGSTVGIESAYWGKPSILGGKALYQHLESVYTPNSHAEVMDLLLREDLPPLSSQGALQYGYFYNSFGIPLKNYQAKNFFAGTYKNQSLFPSKWLFRLFTAYKRFVPKSVQDSINKNSIVRTFENNLSR